MFSVIVMQKFVFLDRKQKLYIFGIMVQMAYFCLWSEIVQNGDKENGFKTEINVSYAGVSLKVRV